MVNLSFRSSLPRSIIIYVRTNTRLKAFFILLPNQQPQQYLNSRRHHVLIDVEFMLMSAPVYPRDWQLSLFIRASRIKDD